VVVVHVSRRTNISYARERLAEAAGPEAGRIHILMDHRSNRQRYERQVQEAGGEATKQAQPAPDQPA
jgi:hypothetical protein